MAAAGVSPSSSPRLPSPPPFTEVQIGPKSPSVGESFSKEAEQFLAGSRGHEDGPTRRIRPGTRAGDMAVGPPLVPLSQLDSPFQLQEHLKALYNHFTRPEGSETVVPISREVAIQLAEPPEGIDRSLWLYELCRFLTMKVNNLIIAFFAENPPCSSQTCPEMRASEWQYLCAVHDPPKSCCAIDYCCHTLDWATNILTSPKYFPSRLTLGSEAGGGAQASMRHLTNIFRRLYRIFAHAWFQHREVFWQVEGHDGLYIFFKTVCDMYNLIPEDNYTVPAEAEGLDPNQETQEQADGHRMTILRKENDTSHHSALDTTDPPSISTGATTRRHKGSPSISSRVVTTINESAEDNEEEKTPQTDEVPEVPEPKEAEAQPTVEVTSEEHEESTTEQPSSETTVSQVTVKEVKEDEEATEPSTPEVSETNEQNSTSQPPQEQEETAESDESKAEAQTSSVSNEDEKTSSSEEQPTQQSEPESELKGTTTGQEPESEAELAKET